MDVLSLVGLGTAVTSAKAGFVAPIVNSLTVRLSLVLVALSVTVMMQLSYVPSFNGVELSGCVSLTVLLPDDADDEDELPQAPPYVMVPASFEEKV